ncbi:hypothetical protein [Actinophytocola algeriensis]|uniref:Uncharacterized protein n=1 Tax=Actinophytocola algeriensis TaxID=1768010 RepID=A0A7W7Q888_9PSEU|nr:hypothetical protein [Actinophytocola algeriensis]MBB4908464.1 hypothetical protein [Actinophytocola algeriensis]MBE1475149.1 hypothetical protein [Actinophytocola algeriensis]
MKLGLALRELHRAERSLARDLLAVADRHHVEHEIHHVANDLVLWSADHLSGIADAARRYDLDLDPGLPGRGPGAALRAKLSDLTGRFAAPGLLLLADLRRLHRKAAGVSLDWELVAQGAQAVKDTDLLALTQKCHPQTLRQLTWTNAMLKTLSPQVLAS